MKWLMLFFKILAFCRRQGTALQGKQNFLVSAPIFTAATPRGPWAATFTPAAFPLAELSSEHPTPHGPRPLSSGYSPQAGHGSRTHPTGGARGRETATRPGPPPPLNPSTELRLRLTPRPMGAHGGTLLLSRTETSPRVQPPIRCEPRSQWEDLEASWR